MQNVMKLAVTGSPGSGKTVLCGRIAEALTREPGIKVGGIVTSEIRDRAGKRLGFRISDLGSAETGTLAHVDYRSGPRVGKYRVNVEALESIGVAAIEGALQAAHCLVIDEIAPMELKSRRFISVVERALVAEIPLLAAFQKRSRHPLVQAVRRTSHVYTITPANRDDVRNRILGGLRETLRPGGPAGPNGPDTVPGD